MNNKAIHIISFNVPSPPDYGGIIDIFYKISALKACGIEVILHCFLYDRKKSSILNTYCKKVYYYTRKTGIASQLSKTPYIVFSRRSEELLTNLLKDDFPILFEGLHTCFYLCHPELKNRLKIVRTHNIEHQYYHHLAKAEKSLFSKLFFYIESKKLFFFEKRLKHANYLATISENDLEYFKKINPASFLLHPFHSANSCSSKTGCGDYFLYHGNLSVPENKIAVDFFIKKVFSKLNQKLVIAGKNPDSFIKNEISLHSNILLVENPDQQQMQNLISNAQGIVLYTEQETGIKLKLLESLFKARFCIANNKIVSSTGLKSTCIIANNAEEFILKINNIDGQEYSKDDLNTRKEAIKNFIPAENILQIIERI